MSSIPFPLLAAIVVDTSDCELVRSGFPTQPVATWSSLAYVVAGLWVVLVAGRAGTDQVAARAAGALVVLAGLGSVVYHGLGGELSRWVHDAGFLWALAFMAACEGIARPSALFRQAIVFGGAVIGAAAAVPMLTNPMLAVVGGAVAWAESVRWPARPRSERRALVGVAGLLLAAGAAYLLGRTGSPICEPGSAVQLHAVWHLLTAAALALWARVAFSLQAVPTDTRVR
jgi:hypothetical protein